MVCLPDTALSYLPGYGLVAGWLLTAITVLAWQLRAAARPTLNWRWSLSENGAVTLLADDSQQPAESWQLSSQSRVAWWGIYVVLYTPDGKQGKRFWVLRGELSEQNYRRLCRQVIKPVHINR